MGARSLVDIVPNETIKRRLGKLDPQVPFPQLKAYLSEFDLAGLTERVSWLEKTALRKSVEGASERSREQPPEEAT